MNSYKLTLYFSLRSPFARRIRIALQRLNIPAVLREVDLFKILPPDFVSVGPVGRVPVLKIEGPSDGPVALYESEIILNYLHDNYGRKIWPDSLEQKLRIQEASALCVGCYEYLVLYYLEKLRKAQDPELLKEYQRVIENTFEALEAKCVGGMPFEVSKLQLTQAGYDLQTLLDYAEIRMPSLDPRSRFPRLKAFQERQSPRQDLILTKPPA